MVTLPEYMIPLNPLLEKLTPSVATFVETAAMFARVPPPSDEAEEEPLREPIKLTQVGIELRGKE